MTTKFRGLGNVTSLSSPVFVDQGFEKHSAGNFGSVSTMVATTRTAGDWSDTSLFVSSQGLSRATLCMGSFKLSHGMVASRQFDIYLLVQRSRASIPANK